MDVVYLILPGLAHFLIGLYFVIYGILNIYQWRPNLEKMAQKNIPHSYFFLSIGIVWQFVAGLLIMIGFFVKLAALSLIPFTFIAVFIYHDFWNHTHELRRESMNMFIINMTVVLGALILLLNTVTPVTQLADFLT